MQKEDVLKACTIEGNTVKLPPVTLDRKLYKDVAKSLNLIGGKWKGGKIAGFVFPNDPTELLKHVQNGGNRNLKKEFQFFGTPPQLAARLVELSNLQPGDCVLEPSAGQGAILEAIHSATTTAVVKAIELMPTNCQILKQKGYEFKQADFLESAPFLYGTFDKIIANPPFSKNQDIDHICQMYLCLKPGGKIVTIAGKHWQHAKEAKCKQFRSWIDEVRANIIEVPAGAFKESGTSIATCIIIIDKAI